MSKNKLRNKNKGISLLLLLAEFFCVFTGCSQVSDSTYLQDPIEYAAEDTHSAPITITDFSEVIMDYANTIPSDALEWIDYYNEKCGDDKSKEVVMTKKQIDKLNLKITDTCDAVYDMTYTGSTVAASEVRAMIELYSIPSTATVRRDGGVITDAERELILANRNLDKLIDEVSPKTALITSRCNLRSLPTDIGFYNAGDTYYDRIMETELITGFPVLVLHESADGKFLFVESYFYRGWVDSSFVLHCTTEEYELFRSPDRYVTVTEAKIKVMGSVLNMGARLPYVSEDGENYYVKLPTRENTVAVAAIPKSEAVYGSLSLTMENYYAQAFKFLGTDYGWGGADGNVDCSGYVCAVMRSFGIYLPRNTKDQSTMEVLLTKLSGSDDATISGAISRSSAPCAIYRPGHVMLYLGEKDGVMHIIHAPTGGDKVKVAPLTYVSNITGIRTFK